MCGAEVSVGPTAAVHTSAWAYYQPHDAYRAVVSAHDGDIHVKCYAQIPASAWKKNSPQGRSCMIQTALASAIDACRAEMEKEYARRSRA